MTIGRVGVVSESEMIVAVSTVFCGSGYTCCGPSERIAVVLIPAKVLALQTTIDNEVSLFDHLRCGCWEIESLGNEAWRIPANRPRTHAPIPWLLCCRLALLMPEIALSRVIIESFPFYMLFEGLLNEC